MEIPKERLIQILGEFMSEYSFGYKMPVYDVLAIAENFVSILFAVHPMDLDTMAKEVLFDAKIEEENRGKELFAKLSSYEDGH